MREPSDELRRARRAIDGLPCIKSIGDWVWNEEKQEWSLHIGVRHGASATEHIPENTYWYAVTNDEHLCGGVEFFPADTDGVATTFHHQRYNTIDNKLRRRTGNPCLTRPSDALRRAGGNEPPAGVDGFVWRVQRLVEWLGDAASGTLVRPGEPFELPDFRNAEVSKRTFAFQEDVASLAEWRGVTKKFGAADVYESARLMVVKEFRGAGGFSRSLDWGGVSDLTDKHGAAVWVLLDDVPILAPWHPPDNFGELKGIASRQGLDLSAIVSEVADSRPMDLRRGQRILLLVGFPTPEAFGASPHSIHWQAGFVSPVSRTGSSGFRDQSLSLRDKQFGLPDNGRIEWLRSENWTETNLMTRGAFGKGLRDKRVVIVGMGCLGSAVADMLARGGFNDFVLVDGDVFRAGNASRHVLDLGDAGKSKADAMGERLRLIRPTVQVESIDRFVGAVDGEQLKPLIASGLVIDTTGSNSVLLWAERSLRESDATFVSLSFGFGAKRLFCFASPPRSFNERGFAEAVNPWLLHERATRPGDDNLPREGIGCWSVVFPAKADDMWLLGATAVKWIESLPDIWEQDVPVFDVFEQHSSGVVGFSGIRRAELPPQKSV